MAGPHGGGHHPGGLHSPCGAPAAWRRSCAQALEEYLALGFFGLDKEGHPIRYECPGKIDSRGIMRAACRSDLIKFRTVYMMENAMRLCREVGLLLRAPNMCRHPRHTASSWTRSHLWLIWME
jgi:hypothetical protein